MARGLVLQRTCLMGRKQKKRGRPNEPGFKPSTDVPTDRPSSVGSRRFLLAAGTCVLALTGLWVAWWSVDSWDASGDGQAVVPEVAAADNSPPADPSEVFGLPRELPTTVETLKDDTLQATNRLVHDLPDRPESHAVRAVVFKRFGNTGQASTSWHECLALNPNFAPALLGLGTVAAAKAQTEQAIEYLSQAIAHDPNLAAAYSALTEVLLQSGQAERALELTNRYVTRFPDSSESHYWQGQAYLQLRRYEQAMESHQQALRIDPELTHSYHSLATACMFLGQVELAKEYREKFAKLKTFDLQEDRGRNLEYRDFETLQEVAAEAYHSAGNVYQRFGQATKAEACWIRGSELWPHDQRNHSALVRFYEDADRLALAVDHARQLTDLAPENTGYWLDLGRLLTGLGQLDDAERAYRTALNDDGESLAAYRGLVNLYLQSEDVCDDALALAERAVELSPNVESWVQLAAVRQTQGDHSGARDAITEALRLEPGNQQLRQLDAQFRKQ